MQSFVCRHALRFFRAVKLEMIIGKSADPAFLDVVREMAETHDPAVSLDVVRAYHFGPKFLVELEVSASVHVCLAAKSASLIRPSSCRVHADCDAGGDAVARISRRWYSAPAQD